MPSASPHKASGRRSSNRTWQRTFLLLQILMTGEAPPGDLMDQVNCRLGDEGYSHDRQAARYALRHDLNRLKTYLGCEIAFHRRSGAYHLIRPPFPLPLSPEDLQALALVREAFPPTAPHAAEVEALLQRLEFYLDDKARETLRRSLPISFATAPAEDLSPLAGDIRLLEKAIRQHQPVEFHYYSPEQQTRKRHWNIEPLDLVVREEHLYLEAYHAYFQNFTRFRVDRIEPGSVRLFPTVLPPGKRHGREYTLRFRLTPERARFGVTERFPEQQAEVQPDGSVLVTARITNTFEAVRTLLRYADGVECLEPPQVRDEIRRVVRELGKIYKVVAEDAR